MLFEQQNRIKHISTTTQSSIFFLLLYLFSFSLTLLISFEFVWLWIAFILSNFNSEIYWSVFVFLFLFDCLSIVSHFSSKRIRLYFILLLRIQSQQRSNFFCFQKNIVQEIKKYKDNFRLLALCMFVAKIK